MTTAEKIIADRVVKSFRAAKEVYTKAEIDLADARAILNLWEWVVFECPFIDEEYRKNVLDKEDRGNLGE